MEGEKNKAPQTHLDAHWPFLLCCPFLRAVPPPAPFPPVNGSVWQKAKSWCVTHSLTITAHYHCGHSCRPCFKASFKKTDIWDIKEWDAPCLLCHLQDQRPPEMERAHNIIHANPFISSVSMSSMLRGAARMIKQINWKSSDCVHLLSSRSSDSSWTLMVKNKYHYYYHHLLLSLSSPVYMQDSGWAKEPDAHLNRWVTYLWKKKPDRFAWNYVKRQKPLLLPGAPYLHPGRGVPPLPKAWHKWKGTHMD